MFLICPEKSKDLEIPSSHGNYMPGARSESKNNMGQVREPGQSSEERGRSYHWVHKLSTTQKGLRALKQPVSLPFPRAYHPLSGLSSAPPTSAVWPRAAFHSFNLCQSLPQALNHLYDSFPNSTSLSKSNMNSLGHGTHFRITKQEGT